MKRRSFLKGVGTVGLALLSSPLSPLKSLADADKGPVYAMIIDLNRCIGCQACTVACQVGIGDPPDGFNTTVRYLEAGTYPRVRQHFIPLQCNQCQNPPCMAACKAGAIKQLDNGIIITDWSVCDGSGACVDACPFGMRYMVLNEKKSAKCDFCLQRIERGKEPLCVATCPSRARLFGDLTRPEGEFAQYLKKKFLFQLSGRQRQQSHVFYAGDKELARLVLKEG